MSVNLDEGRSHLKCGVPKRTIELYFLSLAMDKSKKCGAIILPKGTLFRGGGTISKEELQDLAGIYKKFQEIENVSKFISCDEILKNDGVLNIVRYIEPKVCMKSTKSIIEEMKVSMEKRTKYRDVSDKILGKI